MRFVLPLLFGLIGCSILVGLGVWQLQRLTWKEGVLSQMAAQISDDPAALPETPDPERDGFLSVRMTGRTDGQELHVLASLKQRGAVYRVIAPMDLDDGRRVLVDLGLIDTEAKNDPRPAQNITVAGNLHWPQETDSYTPDPDINAQIWFARDVALMAAALNTEPVMVVARALEPGIEGVLPLPVAVDIIPNDHLQYAMTWFALAMVWAGMTGYLLWRMRRGQGKSWD